MPIKLFFSELLQKLSPNSSKSELCRLAQQSRFSIDGVKTDEVNADIDVKMKCVKIGKRKWSKFIINSLLDITEIGIHYEI
jgi:hypothetical protein